MNSITDLESKRADLWRQIEESLQGELTAVRKEIDASDDEEEVDDPCAEEDAITALQLQYAELKQLEADIESAIKGSLNVSPPHEVAQKQRQHHEDEAKLESGIQQIRTIEDQLSGKVLIPCTRYRDVHGDMVSDLPEKRTALQALRAKLVGEFGSLEDYERLKNERRIQEIEDILAGKQRLPELPYAVTAGAGRHVEQMLKSQSRKGKDVIALEHDYLESKREELREELRNERALLQAKLTTEIGITVSAGS